MKEEEEGEEEEEEEEEDQEEEEEEEEEATGEEHWGRSGGNCGRIFIRDQRGEKTNRRSKHAVSIYRDGAHSMPGKQRVACCCRAPLILLLVAVVHSRSRWALSRTTNFELRSSLSAQARGSFSSFENAVSVYQLLVASSITSGIMPTHAQKNRARRVLAAFKRASISFLAPMIAQLLCCLLALLAACCVF
jgi:hypothetical protein